jgi:anti-sigma B factor antagonist
MPRELNISVRHMPRATVIDLTGAIDIGNSHGLRSTLFAAIPATPRLALNMAAVRYIDSSGIATLVEVFRMAQDSKKEFVLFGLGSRVYDVLKLTKLLKVFKIFDTEEAALDEGAAPPG